MGSLRSFEIYKYFCAPQMGTRHVSFMPCHRARGPPPWWWSLSWSSTLLRPPTRRRPSARSPLASSLPSELEQSSAVLTVLSYTRREGVLQMLLWSEGSPRPTYEGELHSEIFMTSGPHPQQCAPPDHLQSRCWVMQTSINCTKCTINSLVHSICTKNKPSTYLTGHHRSAGIFRH
jgi:hypothetical protein